MKALILLFLLSFQMVSYAASGQTLVEIRPHNELHKRIYQVYYDVFVTRSAKPVNLTKFGPWEEIIDFAVSPDSNYCFVRHKPNKTKTAYRLTLYDLRTFRKIKEIIPGYGGSFEWNNNLQILHSWGCGTNCANLRVYNLQLKEIFFTLSSGGFKYSPQKNFAVQFSMQGDKIWVFDLRSLKSNSLPKTYAATIETGYDWDDFQFPDEYNIIISKEGALKPSLNINLNEVAWKRVNPGETGAFRKRSF